MSFSTVVQKLLAAKTLEGVKELNNEARDLHEKLCDLQVRFQLPGCRVGLVSRGRRERYPGTHGYQGTGRYPSKFWKFGYRWVPGTGKIWEIGYRWVPGTEQILEVGYRWVPGTGQIFEVGYRWVPGTEEILQIGHRWVPGTEQISEVGYNSIFDNQN